MAQTVTPPEKRGGGHRRRRAAGREDRAIAEQRTEDARQPARGGARRRRFACRGGRRCREGPGAKRFGLRRPAAGGGGGRRRLGSRASGCDRAEANQKLALVDVDAKMIHGWPLFAAALTAGVLLLGLRRPPRRAGGQPLDLKSMFRSWRSSRWLLTVVKRILDVLAASAILLLASPASFSPQSPSS